VARHRGRRQSLPSPLLSGRPGTGRKRRLNANAKNAKNKSPAVNFDNSAPARLNANRRTFLRLGSRQTWANVHNASRQNSAAAMSVCTRGPKVRNADVLIKRLRQSSPPHGPASLLARMYRLAPRISVNSSMGKRAHLRMVFGSFHFSRNHSPKTHCPRYAGKNFSLKVQEMWL